MDKDKIDSTDQSRGSDSIRTNGTGSSCLPAGRSPAGGFSARWTAAIDAIERRFTAVLRIIARHATRYPKSYIVGVIAFSLAMLGVGYMTNFNVLVDDKILWTPAGSKPVVHMQWIRTKLPQLNRIFVLFLHANGENVIQQEAFERLFDALDLLRGLPEYDSLCSEGSDDELCYVYGVTTFWNNNKTLYQEQVKSHEDLIKAVSSPVDARGLPVDFEAIVGFPVYGADGVTVESGKSCMVFFSLPEVEGALELEYLMIDTLVTIRKEWAGQDTIFHLEGQAEESSMDEEFYRGIIKDVPLIPLGFVVMSIFTCLTFYNRDPIQSRCWVGFGAIVSVLLSIMTGYGIMFCIGVPFTSITSILPFVMFGKFRMLLPSPFKCLICLLNN
jgi:Patched family